jgi:long-subunit fatty acid transport protein
MKPFITRILSIAMFLTCILSITITITMLFLLPGSPSICPLLPTAIAWAQGTTVQARGTTVQAQGTTVQAQGTAFEPPEIKFSSSLNPVGSGARALGMGGAFIAFADDATAASWNPAGLKHLLEPEMSIVGQYDDRREGFSFSRSPEASNQYQLSSEHLNYLSLAYPFQWMDRNFVFSLNYQNLYSLNRQMHYLYPYQNPNINMNYEVTYRQKGNLKAVSPAIATFLTRTLSFGLTFNFWSDKLYDNGWVEDYSRSGRGTVKVGGETWGYESFTDKTDRYSFSGFNMNLGLLWDISSSLTLGAVVKSPFTARLKYEGKSLSNQVWPNGPGQEIPYYTSQCDDQKLSLPLSYGIGLAVRPSDRLIFDLDIYRTEWNGYVLEDDAGHRIDPITCLPKEESRIEPTHQVRLGSEYVFLHKGMTLSPRLGLFYDPEPARGKPDDFYGFSLGFGVTLGRMAPVAIDLAYQYRFGRNVEADSIKGQTSPADVRQHLFYHSVIYYF